MNIPTKSVKSSSIKAIGYDPATKTLAVRWKNDTLYHYAAVSEKQYSELAQAESHGRHVMQHIIPKHKHTKIE